MQKKFLLRISPELWDDIERWAHDDLRSVNGQIEFLLRDAVRRRRGVPASEAGDTPQQTDDTQGGGNN